MQFFIVAFSVILALAAAVFSASFVLSAVLRLMSKMR